MQQFKIEKKEVFDLLKSFSAINIVDSSTVSLPEALKDLYKGCGGAASEAGLKLQVLLDYLCGQINNITITEARKNDQSYDGHLEKIKKGALYLQDLGYFKIKSFEKMDKEGAYFISRYCYPTIFLDERGNAINLIKKLRRTRNFFTQTVWLGKEGKMKVQLVAFRMSNEETKKRIEKIKKTGKKRHKMPTKIIFKLARWSIYITNVPRDMLKNKHIHMLYALRWQIELFFKLCKSEIGIDKIRGKKPSRVLCEIYAKLICAIMLLYLCFPLRWECGREISFIKAYKILSVRALDFFRALRSQYLLVKFFKSLLRCLKDFAFKDRPRITRLMAYQKLMQATNYGGLV